MIMGLDEFELKDLARLPGRVFKGLLTRPADVHAFDEMLAVTLNFISNAAHTGDQAACERGWRFRFVLPHLALPALPRHDTKGPKSKDQDIRRKTNDHLHKALTKTHAHTAETLRDRIRVLVARLTEQPREARELTPEQDMQRLIQGVKTATANNEMTRATPSLAALSAAASGVPMGHRVGCVIKFSDELLEKFQAMHPPAGPDEPDAPEIPPDTASFQASTSDVLEALRSFKRSTGLGPSSLPLQALRSVARRQSGEDSASLKALTRLVCDILRGALPPAVKAVFASARLVGLTKANGEPRPIAVGEIDRRLAGKCAAYHCRDNLAKLLAPTQRGVAIPGGPEQLAHIVSTLLEANPTFCVLTVDIRNAFNRILRSHLLKVILESLPSLAKMVYMLYGSAPPFLWLDHNEFIESLRGVQQGDPCAPLLFALGFHPVLLAVRAAHPNIHVAAGHDDLSLVGSPTDCLAAHASFVQAVGEIGLEAEPAKSFIYSPHEGVVLQEAGAYHGIARPVPVNQGVTIFGTPVGSAEWVQKRLRKLLNEHRVILRALPLVGSAQCSQHVIATALTARVTHLLRTLPPAVTEDYALTHDSQIWHAFGHCTGRLSVSLTEAGLQPLVEDGPWPQEQGHWLQTALGEQEHPPLFSAGGSVADWAWRQAQLRRADGGCGIGNAVQKREAAFVSSWALGIHGGILEDFPGVGEAFRRAEAERTPQIAGLASAWAAVSHLVEAHHRDKCTGVAGLHDDHSGLCCLEAMAAPARASRVGEEEEEEGPSFVDHLQRRLMRQIQRQTIATVFDDASVAWQNCPTRAGRYDALVRWARLAAVSGSYAHAALTSLPDAPGSRGFSTLDNRTINVLLCFRLGVPPPDFPGLPAPTTCPLHDLVQELADGLSHHMVHCGRQTPHVIHTELLKAFAHVADAVPGLSIRIEEAIFAGSGARMDLVLGFPLAEVQTLNVDVTGGTAMSRLDYAGEPHAGVTNGKTLSGGVARAAESGKNVKYGPRIAEAGPEGFEGACIEDLGTWGAGARRTLRYIADAAYGVDLVIGDPNRDAKARFIWLAAQHISLQAARGVVRAHDKNLLEVRNSLPENIRRFASGSLQDAAFDGGFGPMDGAARLQAPPRYHRTSSYLGFGSALHSDRRPETRPFASRDDLEMVHAHAQAYVRAGGVQGGDLFQRASIGAG